MEVNMENELLMIKSSNNGGELISIKDKNDGTEYLWIGESSYWGRHAPILFPIVGKVKDGYYRVGDNKYKLGQHGFARDSKFQIVESNAKSVLYRLVWSEESLKMYPYKFELDIKYSLVGKTIKVAYTVRNEDSDSIYFSIGAHPGFNCPFINANKADDCMCFEDYYLEFEEKETASVMLLSSGGYLSRKTAPFLDNSNIINLSRELFEKDALIFKYLKSKKISLKNKYNSKAVTVEFDGFPFLGIWSKPEGAPFVCIEPWYGHADFDDFNEDFRYKEDSIRLEAGRKLSCTYSITV